MSSVDQPSGLGTSGLGTSGSGASGSGAASALNTSTRSLLCPLRLNGKRGIIFGVANHRSIAWACAERLMECGAEVILAVLDERSEKRARSLLAEREEESEHAVYQCDLRVEDELLSLIDTVKRNQGKIDFVIHSVAFAHLEDLKQPISQCRQRGFLDAMEVSAFSLLSIVNACRELWSESASVVTMSYIGAEIAIPSYGVMGPIKAALEAEVRYLAAEVGERGVRVNAVSAGPLKTLAASAVPGFRKQLKESGDFTPLKRRVNHREVADTVCFLCSQMSSGITGEVIHVDAGQHAVRMQ